MGTHHIRSSITSTSNFYSLTWQVIIGYFYVVSLRKKKKLHDKFKRGMEIKVGVQVVEYIGMLRTRE